MNSWFIYFVYTVYLLLISYTWYLHKQEPEDYNVLNDQKLAIE